jgi:hypothetical protein
MPDETWSWPDTMDATVAAPESHRVLYEDDRTRVLEVVIPPGVREPEHTHARPRTSTKWRTTPTASS